MYLVISKYIISTVISTLSKMEIDIHTYTAISGYVQQALINNIHLPMQNDKLSAEAFIYVFVPGLASNENLAGIHDTTG